MFKASSIKFSWYHKLKWFLKTKSVKSSTVWLFFCPVFLSKKQVFCFKFLTKTNVECKISDSSGTVCYPKKNLKLQTFRNETKDLIFRLRSINYFLIFIKNKMPKKCENNFWGVILSGVTKTGSIGLKPTALTTTTEESSDPLKKSLILFLLDWYFHWHVCRDVCSLRRWGCGCWSALA